MTPEFAPFLTQVVSLEEMDLPFYRDSYIRRSKNVKPEWNDELIHDLECPVKLENGTVAGEVVDVHVYRLKGEEWRIWSADTPGRVSGGERYEPIRCGQDSRWRVHQHRLF